MDFLQIIESKKRKDINSQNPEVLFSFFQTGTIFTRFLGVAFCLGFFQFLQSIPCRQTTHPLFTGYGDLQLQFFVLPCDCKRAVSGISSPAAAEVISQSAGPATDQDSK